MDFIDYIDHIDIIDFIDHIDCIDITALQTGITGEPTLPLISAKRMSLRAEATY